MASGRLGRGEVRWLTKATTAGQRAQRHKSHPVHAGLEDDCCCPHSAYKLRFGARHRWAGGTDERRGLTIRSLRKLLRVHEPADPFAHSVSGHPRTGTLGVASCALPVFNLSLSGRRAEPCLIEAVGGSRSEALLNEMNPESGQLRILLGTQAQTVSFSKLRRLTLTTLLTPVEFDRLVDTRTGRGPRVPAEVHGGRNCPPMVGRTLGYAARSRGYVSLHASRAPSRRSAGVCSAFGLLGSSVRPVC